MADEWMGAKAAHELISTIAPLQASQLICGRACDGLIAAQAKRFVSGDQVQDDVEIPEHFWWARGQMALSQNWAAGDFDTWIDKKLHCRAYGVRFKRSDIESMLPRQQSRGVLTRSEPGNYESAAMCIAELCQSLNCDEPEAETLILKNCRAGLIPGRCAEIHIRTQGLYGRSEEAGSNAAIPDWFWEKCLDHSDVVLDWHANRFAGRGHIDGDDRKVTMTGVEFQVGAIVDLEAMARRARAQRQSASSERPITIENVATNEKRAGRRLSDRWIPWIAELVAHVHENGIPDGQGSQGQEELINAVANALGERGIESLGRTTVQKAAQAVLDRLRAAEN